MRLRSDRIVTPRGTTAGEVAIQGAAITAVTSGRPSRSTGASRRPGSETVIDLGDSWLVPGFIDTHVHGGGGAQFNTSDPDEVAEVAAFHAAHGTTAVLATTVAAPPEELEAALAAIAAVARRDGEGRAAVLGAHLEGPFLSRARPGAMDPAAFLHPAAAILGRLLEAGHGTVRMMTFAPELPGAAELVRALADAGIVASIGYTEASYEQARAAVSAGAHAATHVFNAMAPLDHRRPGVLGAVLDSDQVSIELICDGVHVHPAVLRLALRVKGPDRVRLVTDAIAAAGMPDGEYRLGARRVSVTGGRATLAGGGPIAGSTLTMEAAVANAVRFAQIGVEQAVAMASANPARLLGVGERKGAIAAGRDADLTVLDDELSVRGTLVGGAWVGGPPRG